MSGLKLDQFEKEVQQLVSCVQPTFACFEIWTNGLCDGEDSSVRCILTAHRNVDLAPFFLVAECHATVYIGEVLLATLYFATGVNGPVYPMRPHVPGIV